MANLVHELGLFSLLGAVIAPLDYGAELILVVYWVTDKPCGHSGCNFLAAWFMCRLVTGFNYAPFVSWLCPKEKASGCGPVSNLA